MGYFKRGVRYAKNISWYKYFGAGRKARQRANLAAYVRFICILFAGIKKKQYLCSKPLIEGNKKGGIYGTWSI